MVSDLECMRPLKLSCVPTGDRMGFMKALPLRALPRLGG